MTPLKEEIQSIVNQIVAQYHPIEIILFGSCTKASSVRRNDIDLCIICDYKNKRELLTDMILNIKSERDIDIILYKPEQWEKYKKDPATFGHDIHTKGIKLYSRNKKKEK